MPVKILLQPSEDLKNLDFTKHKFLLQTMIIDDKNYPDLFKKEILNEKSPDEIFKDKLLNKFSTSKKLFCRFNNLGGDDKVKFPPSYQETVQIRQNNQKLRVHAYLENLLQSVDMGGFWVDKCISDHFWSFPTPKSKILI